MACRLGSSLLQYLLERLHSRRHRVQGETVPKFDAGILTCFIGRPKRDSASIWIAGFCKLRPVGSNELLNVFSMRNTRGSINQYHDGRGQRGEYSD